MNPLAGFRASFQGYGVPLRRKPEWTVDYLVFQSGNMNQRQGSITGGGQIYGHEYQAYFNNLTLEYSVPITNVVAGGQINAAPAWLQALLGGASGNGS